MNYWMSLKGFKGLLLSPNSILAFWNDVITASLGYIMHADEDMHVTAVMKYKNNKHGSPSKTVI